MAIPLTRATVSRPSLSVTSWGIFTHTGILLSMMLWFVCLRTGKTVRFWLKCTVITVPWTGIHLLLCVIQRLVCLRLQATFFKISRKRPFLLHGTLTIPRKSRQSCQQHFQTSWSMVRLGFRLVMPQTFLPII
ncbi:hypothetical protein D8834_03655 [Streptococcus oralis]|nr:hypothetical protein D8834_03655 [Streptococcus oralis]